MHTSNDFLSIQCNVQYWIFSLFFRNKNGEINSERVHYPALSTQWGEMGHNGSSSPAVGPFIVPNKNVSTRRPSYTRIIYFANELSS